MCVAHERLLAEAAERRIAAHVRLYTRFVCNKTDFYVAHRDYVTRYGLAAGADGLGRW
jgi:hypothetical protein